MMKPVLKTENWQMSCYKALFAQETPDFNKHAEKQICYATPFVYFNHQLTKFVEKQKTNDEKKWLLEPALTGDLFNKRN